MVSDKVIWVHVDEKQHEFIRKIAEQYGTTMSGFCKQAALEKALGQNADKSTSELIMEIQVIKDLIVQRNKNAQDAKDSMAATATIDTAGTGIPEDEIKGKILHVLAASPPLNTHDLAKATGYPEKLVYLALTKLIEAMLVVMDERSFEYRLVR